MVTDAGPSGPEREIAAAPPARSIGSTPATRSTPSTPATPSPPSPPSPPSTSATTRRERKKLRTRDALEAAALRLFAEKGYEETTVEEIAEGADVAVRTFFRYFRSKQHVLFGDVATDITSRLRGALGARPADEQPIDAVAAGLAALALTTEDDRREVLERLRLVEKMPELGGTYHMIMQELHDVIADFVSGRIGGAMPQLHPQLCPQPFPQLYPQLVAGAATAAIKAAVVIFATDPSRSPADISAQAYALLTAGLRDVTPGNP